VQCLHSFGVKGSLEKLGMLDSLSCGSSVIVFVVTGMVVIARPGYLNGWMIWKTESNSPLML
jgi:hypothetical protein